MVSNASELLPEPDRPVITISLSRGRSRSMFLRLWVRAPRIRMKSIIRGSKGREIDQSVYQEAGRPPKPERGLSRGRRGPGPGRKVPGKSRLVLDATGLLADNSASGLRPKSRFHPITTEESRSC